MWPVSLILLVRRSTVRLCIFYDRLERRPRLREEHFLRAVFDNMDADAMFITGVREEASIAAYSHLVPKSRLIEIRVEASEQT